MSRATPSRNSGLASHPHSGEAAPVPTPTPTAVWSGTLRFGGVELDAHVLDDGRRIIDQDSLLRFLDAITTHAVTAQEAQDFADFLKGRGLPEGGAA